jgi:hypothetical protein
MKKLIFLSLIFVACSAFDWPCHPNGDLWPCTHRLHVNDTAPCTHFNYLGERLHSYDYYPCTHVIHLAGDLYPCTHYCN